MNIDPVMMTIISGLTSILAVRTTNDTMLNRGLTFKLVVCTVHSFCHLVFGAIGGVLLCFWACVVYIGIDGTVLDYLAFKSRSLLKGE